MPRTTGDGPWRSVPGAARYFGIAAKTLRARIRNGEIPPHCLDKWGNEYRIHIGRLEAYRTGIDTDTDAAA